MFRLKRRRKIPQREPSKPKKLNARLSLSALRYAFDAVCALLLFAALAQTSVIVVVGLGRPIPLPPQILADASRKLESYGLKAKCDRVYFDLTGGILVKNIRLTDSRGNNLLTAAQAYLHIPPESIENDSPEPDTIRIDDASVVLPAYVSESGTSQPIAQNISAIGFVGGHSIHVAALQGKIAAIPTSMRNGFDIRIAETARAKNTTAVQTNIPRTLLPRLKIFANACTSQGEIDGAILSLAPERDLSKVNAFFFAKSLSRDDWKVENLSARFPIGKNLVLGKTELFADSFEWKALSLSNLQITSVEPIKIPSNSDFAKNVSAKASVSAASVIFRGETAKGISLHLNRLPSFFSASACFTLDGNPEHLSIAKPDGGTSEIEYECTTTLETCVRIAKLPREQIENRLAVSQPFRVTGKASLPSGIKGWKTDFELWVRGMNAKGYDFDSLYGKGTARRNFLKLTKISARSGDSQAEGTYTQDFTTMDWRMDIKGSVFPPELTPMLGHWWSTIWPDFTFDGPRATADLSIQGNWRHRHYAIVKGDVTFGRIMYNGVRIDNGSLKLNVGEDFVDIYDLAANTENGGVRGRLSWLLRRDDDMMTVVANVISDAPVTDVDKAFGSPLKTLIPDWVFLNPPKLVFRGNFEKLAPGEWRDTIYAEGNSGPGSWHGVPFDAIAASVWVVGGNTMISISDCMLLSGRLNGGIEVVPAEKGSLVKMNLALDETNFTPTMKALHSLGGKKKDSDAQEKAGKVKLVFSGSAITDDFVNTLNGSGHFLIHDAELGKIKVFGALSTLLDSIGLTSGTFSLNSVKSKFTIQNGLAKLRHGELGGPAIRIEARGSLALTTGDLDFDAKVFLLSGSESSLVNALGAIITPVGYISELSLKGTMDEPTWRFKLDPRNLFKSSPASQEKQKPVADESMKQ